MFLLTEAKGNYNMAIEANNIDMIFVRSVELESETVWYIECSVKGNDSTFDVYHTPLKTSAYLVYLALTCFASKGGSQFNESWTQRVEVCAKSGLFNVREAVAMYMYRKNSDRDKLSDDVKEAFAKLLSCGDETTGIDEMAEAINRRIGVSESDTITLAQWISKFHNLLDANRSNKIFHL